MRPMTTMTPGALAAFADCVVKPLPGIAGAEGSLPACGSSTTNRSESSFGDVAELQEARKSAAATTAARRSTGLLTISRIDVGFTSRLTGEGETRSLH